MTNLILHDYNGHAISQRVDQYVSLTQMAKAEGKQVGHYLALSSTKDYLEALSESIGITIDSLISVNTSKGQNSERGTWAHPEVAIDFAQWVSPSFRVWANRTLRSHIENAAAEPVKVLAPIEESALIATTFSNLLGTVNLGRNADEKAALLAGVNLTVMGMRHPNLRGELMEYHKLLSASTPTQSILLTPTSIGEKLGISARSVNNLLIDAGLQTRVPKEQRSKGEPDYRPTAEGARFASNTLSTGNSGDVSTYQHIKWASETVDVLADFMTARSEGAS